MSGRKLKSIENNENLCPLTRKRVKSTIIASTSIEEMGIGMLESDESSSSASAIALAVSADENSNEATPNLDAPTFYHRSQLHRFSELFDTLDSSTDNASFTDNKTTTTYTSSPSTSQYTTRVNNINNNNNNNKDEKRQSTEKLHNKKVAILGAGAGIVSSASQNKNRSPLATVAYNNNYKNMTNIQQNVTASSTSQQVTPHAVIGGTTSSAMYSCTATSSTSNSSAKHYILPDENFFLYRNQAICQQTSDGKDHFKKISDEIILQIFKWLPKKTLIRCSFVCHRFNRCARDETLWPRLDLGGRSLRSGALGHILPRGVVILRLAQAELNHPVFDSELFHIYPDYETKLQYLDLSMVAVSKPSLKMLLSRCRQLKKLSLECVHVNDEICDEIAKNVNLEALNLAMCIGLEAWSVRKLVTELQNLNSLNISWTNLTVDAVSALVTDVTPNLMRLNLSGCRKTMFDSHLVTLCQRCPQLLELDLSDCTGLTSGAVSAVCKFKMLEYLSLSRCYQISATSYMELKNLETLKYLDVFGILSDTALEMLETSFPSLGINKFIHSSVARPTVGTRRTSIWGLRTRD